MSFSSFLKLFTPPIVLDKLRLLKYKDNNIYTGNFKTWSDAVSDSIGYNSSSILENCKNSILKVKNDEAIFERDSVLLDRPQYAWPLIASLQHIALENNNSLNIIDFGGSLGSTYFQIRPFTKHFKQLNWTIIEQKNFVDCGLKYFSDEHLNFKYTIADALKANTPNCILLSGVLQCLEDPFKMLNEVIDTKTEYLLLDRTSFITGEPRITVLKINDNNHQVSYPLWFFNEDELLAIILKKYDLLIDFDSTADGAFLTAEKKKMYWKGYFFKIKKEK